MARSIDSSADVRFLLMLIIVMLMPAGRNILVAQPLQHVVLVIIDGARYSETLGDTSAQFVPAMRQLAGHGTVVDTMLNDGRTVTRRGIPAIWSGSWSVPVDTVLPGNISTQYATAPTMWEYLRKAGGVDSTQAVYILKQLNSPWLPSYHPDYGPSFWPWYILHGAADRDVWAHAKTVLQANHPLLSVIYLADVDHAGHSGDWNAYTAAIQIADSVVGEIWAFLEADPVFSGHTTIFVTNDHGRHLDGVSNGFSGHGDDCFGCRHVMLLGVGPAVRPGRATSVSRSLTDITPTIGSILHFPTPYATGNVMTEMLSPTVSVTGDITSIPEKYTLEQNFPNPFNPSTRISWTMPEGGRVRLAVFDVLGREVTLLTEHTYSAGVHSVMWNGRNAVSGAYLYRLEVEGADGIPHVESGKMLLLK